MVFSDLLFEGNEKEVGEGIRESKVPRGQIFLTTKLGNSSHKEPEKALLQSLRDLDTPYLDLWLMHWVSWKTPK